MVRQYGRGQVLNPVVSLCRIAAVPRESEDGHCTCAHAQLHVCACEHIVAPMCMCIQAYLCVRETAVPFFAFHHRFAPVSIVMIVEIAMRSCVR